MQRPPQAQPIYRYDKVLLATVVASIAAAWLLAGLATGLPGAIPFAGKLAVSLFLGILTTVLWLDLWGYATLRGLISWRSAHWCKRSVMIGLLILFPVALGVYVVRAVLDSQPARSTGMRQATPPMRFRTTPIGLATLVGVALLALVVSTLGVGAMTRVASAQGPSINSGQHNLRPSVQPTATFTRNHGPAKGKKGHEHQPHHG